MSCDFKKAARKRSAFAHRPRRELLLQPFFDPVGIADTAEFPLRIQQYNKHGTISHVSLHHQTSPSVPGKARLGKAYLPVLIPDQLVGVAKFNFTVADADDRLFAG